MSLRAIRQSARRDLHNTMKVAGFFYAPGVPDYVECFVRVHGKFQKLGDLKGTNFNYAETFEPVTKLVFQDADGVRPVNKAIVMVSATEGYRVGVVEPTDGLETKAHVSELGATELANYDHP